MFPGWRWTPGLDVTAPVQTSLDPAFARGSTHVYLMNLFQEMPLGTWGPGRTQDPGCKVRKGPLLPVYILRNGDGIWGREQRE